MQNQSGEFTFLTSYSFFQSTYNQRSRHFVVCYACHNTPVIQINYRAVIVQRAVSQIKISKVGSPFFIFDLGRKISLQQIGENFMRRGLLVCGLLSANDGSKMQVAIHVFVDSRQTQIDEPPLKIYLHFSVSVDAVVRVVNFFDLGKYV